MRWHVEAGSKNRPSRYRELYRLDTDIVELLANPI